MPLFGFSGVNSGLGLFGALKSSAAASKASAGDGKIMGQGPFDVKYFLSGALAGGICCSITHGALTPVDVVKTRLMTGGGSGGIVGTFNSIIREEGAATLMKGVVPRVVFLAPLAAMTLSLYEAYGRRLVGTRLGVDPKNL
jgi:hypothetical protein